MQLRTHSLAWLAFLPITFAAPLLASRATLPFSRIVAFGDNLSDNGNGSYAHCVADRSNCANSIYGHRTWTNGPVAVSYLADLLGVPLASDLAYGHADGGSKFGATVDNAYTQSMWGAPSSKDQIAAYLASGKPVHDALFFLWIGANDVNLYHIDVGSPRNPAFAREFSARLAAQVGTLLDAGAPYVLVPNIYPKHVSPSAAFYADTPAKVRNLGLAIRQANAAVESALAALPHGGGKVIYFDAFGHMLRIWNDHSRFGITHVGGEFCDGYSQQDWELCVTQGHGDQFYWMQYLDMTTRVHKLVAQRMARRVESFFGA